MNLLTKVRKATENDLEGILGLVRDLAEYEKAPQAVTAGIESYRINFKEGIFDAIVAENRDGQIVGMVLFYLAWSTWKGKMLYLEDFVVKENVRGQGVPATSNIKFICFVITFPFDIIVTFGYKCIVSTKITICVCISTATTPTCMTNDFSPN